VLESAAHLLPRQLGVEAEGAQVLQARLEAMGLHFLTGAETEAIVGNGRVTGVRLKVCPEPLGCARGKLCRRDPSLVEGQLVADVSRVSTGIRLRVELAREAGLENRLKPRLQRG